ncbi:hypothetical protein FACS1894172_13520 [Spirochaetia bacterium]|nr:hypothetical protein FACS1894172_13520 [Spirochaetia bacterium]
MGTFSDTFLLAMHTIKGLLYPNHLENATGKYILHAQHDPKVLTLEDIATSAIQRGGVSLTRDVLIEAYRAMAAEAVHQAADGFIVNTDVIRLAVELGILYD